MSPFCLCCFFVHEKQNVQAQKHALPLSKGHVLMPSDMSAFEFFCCQVDLQPNHIVSFCTVVNGMLCCLSDNCLSPSSHHSCTQTWIRCKNAHFLFLEHDFAPLCGVFDKNCDHGNVFFCFVSNSILVVLSFIFASLSHWCSFHLHHQTGQHKNLLSGFCHVTSAFATNNKCFRVP